jgi:hypothetical protein
MPLSSPERLLRALAAGERGGVFFLFGDEEYLKEEVAERIVEAHLDPPSAAGRSSTKSSRRRRGP